MRKENPNYLFISAKKGIGVDLLKEQLLKMTLSGKLGENNTIISNNRHYDALLKALESIQKVKETICLLFGSLNFDTFMKFYLKLFSM